MSHETQIKKFQNCSVWSHFLAGNFPAPFRLMAKSSFGKISLNTIPGQYQRRSAVGKNWEVSVFIVEINFRAFICSVPSMSCVQIPSPLLFRKKPNVHTHMSLCLADPIFLGSHSLFWDALLAWHKEAKQALNKVLWLSPLVLKHSANQHRQ